MILISNYAAFVMAAGLVPTILRGQSPPDKKSFEVASVKRADTSVTPVSRYEETPGSIQYRCSLLSMVQRAYKLKMNNYQVDHVDLLGKDLYNISAKLPEGAQKDEIPAMLRSLLEERFRFSAHWVERSMQVYRLGVEPAGLKLPPHREQEGKSTVDEPLAFIWERFGLIKVRGPITLERLASFLQAAMDRPVLDETAVLGVFDISLDATIPKREADTSDLRSLPLFQGKASDDLDDLQEPPTPFPGVTGHRNAPEIGAALRKMGLRLDHAYGNVPVLVVDSADRTPTPN
jgi:uncharacterized protein (TIGR03435 family)